MPHIHQKLIAAAAFTRSSLVFSLRLLRGGAILSLENDVLDNSQVIFGIVFQRDDNARNLAALAVQFAEIME